MITKDAIPPFRRQSPPFVKPVPTPLRKLKMKYCKQKCFPLHFYREMVIKNIKNTKKRGDLIPHSHRRMAVWREIITV